MPAHPLEPLFAEEITAAAACIRAQAGLDPNSFFETITLDEPSRAERAAFTENGTIPPRRAYVCCYERTSNRTFRGRVDLDQDKAAVVGSRPRRSGAHSPRRVRRQRQDRQG